MKPSALFLVLALAVLMATVPAVAARPTLTVVNWSWYVEVDESIDESVPIVDRSPVLSAFRDECDCDLIYVELDDEYSIRDYLMADPAGVDVLNLSVGFIWELARKGVVQPIDWTLVPHAEDLRPRFVSVIPPEVRPYQVPYFAGETGILYNRRVVGGELSSWAEFWDLEAPYQVATFITAETVLGTFLMMDGHPISTNEPDALRGAGRRFVEQLHDGRVAYMGNDLEDMAARVKRGDIGASFMFTGDALGHLDEDETGDLAYALPTDGTEFFVDSWAVSAASPRPKLAHAFIDFMLRPEIQARQARWLYTQVVTNEARARLLVEAADDPYLEYFTGHGDVIATESCIVRDSSEAIESLWERILGSQSR